VEEKEQIEVMQKEIQSLKRKALCIGIATLTIMINLIFAAANQVKNYAAIQDYYQSTQERNQELLYYLERLDSELEERNGYLQDILSGMRRWHGCG